MLNKLVCHIILYTFLWVTFAPGFAFAAGTTPSSSGKDKKKAVTKSNLPRNPQEAQKMYAAKEEQRIKKEQARHRAASEALKMKPSDKKSSVVWKACISHDNGTVIEYSSKDKSINISQVPVQNAKTIVNSKMPADVGFYREVTWLNNEVYNVDVTPPSFPLTSYRSRSQFTGEDTPGEWLWRHKHINYVNTPEQGDYYISILAKYTSPFAGANIHSDGTGSYFWISKSVYSSWEEMIEGVKIKRHRLKLYSNDTMWSDSGDEDGWLTSSEFTMGQGMQDGLGLDVGTWNVKSYEGLSTNPDDPTPGTQLFNNDFPVRTITIKKETCRTEPIAASFPSAKISFSVSCDPDNWNLGNGTCQVRIKDGSTVKKVVQGTITHNDATSCYDISCEWDGTGINTPGLYSVQAMVSSSTEYATTISDVKPPDYDFTSWVDIGLIVVLRSEKGLGRQNLNKGEPVNISSGNYYLETNDITLPGRGIPFSLKRYHNSLNPGNGCFGYGWSSSISPSMRVLDNGDVKAMNPDGEYNYYTKGTGNDFTSMSGVHSTLVKNTDNTYTMTHKDKSTTTFNTLGIVSTMKDANNNTLTFNYDVAYKLTSVTDASGRDITFSYDDSKRITRLTDFANRNITYEYDTNGHLTKVTNPLGHTNAYAYNTNHQIINVWDACWNPFVSNTYGTDGKVSSQTLADNTQMSYTYDTTAKTGSVTTGNQTSTYYYDSNDNLTKEEHPLSGATLYAYDENRNMTSITDSLNHTISYAYDANGNPTSTTDADNNTTTVTYNTTFNKPTQINRPLSQTTQFFYDSNGNLTKSTDPLNRDTTMEYDTYGQLTRTTDPLSHSSTCAYDSYGNITSTTNALGKTTTFSYDTKGNVTSTTDPLNHTVTRTYNNNNQLVSVTNPLNKTTSFSYDNNGNLLWTQDPLNRYTGYFYDSMERMTAVQDASQASTHYYFDTYGNMTRMTDARNNSTWYYYDNANRLTTVTDPLSRSDSFAYDVAGRLTGSTDAKGQSITYAYDIMSRLTSKSGAIAITYAFDDLGRRTSMTDSTGTTSFSYDAVNHLTSTTVPGNKTISYAYNNIGALTSRTDAGGVATSFEYDNGNRLTRTTRATKVMTYGYDDANRPTNKTYPNGIQGQFSYDNANQLTTASYLNGGTPFWSCQYAYDDLGNRTSKVIGPTTLTYLYDIVNRLTSTRINGNTQTVYEYDNVGNRTRKITMGTPTMYGYDAANQMTSAGPTTYGYDNNGNRTSSTTGGQTTTYAYDGVDQLTRITYPQAGNPYNTFDYNGDGLRVKTRAKTGAITRFVWSGSDVINEYSDAWTLQKSYYLGGGLEGQIAGTNYNYYHQDGLGSVVSLTGATGNVTDTYDFNEFGTQIFNQGSTANVYRYTGQQSDADSGLYYLRARYYDPSTGLFISKDPNKGDRKNPSSQHPYLYCQNNPINRIDPSGMSSQGPGWGVKAPTGEIIAGGMMASGGLGLIAIAVLGLGGLGTAAELGEGSAAVAALAGSASLLVSARSTLAIISHPGGVACTFWEDFLKNGDPKKAQDAANGYNSGGEKGVRDVFLVENYNSRADKKVEDTRSAIGWLQGLASGIERGKFPLPTAEELDYIVTEGRKWGVVFDIHTSHGALRLQPHVVVQPRTFANGSGDCRAHFDFNHIPGGYTLPTP
jgi:RHS repeat-associated protein